MDCSLPGSSVHEILQARILEWVAISISRGSSWPRGQTCVSCIGRQILYTTEPPGKPQLSLNVPWMCPCMIWYRPSGIFQELRLSRSMVKLQSLVECCWVRLCPIPFVCKWIVYTRKGLWSALLFPCSFLGSPDFFCPRQFWGKIDFAVKDSRTKRSKWYGVSDQWDTLSTPTGPQE